MIRRPCAHDEAVRRAATSGRWTPALQAHASTCNACREILSLTAMLASSPAGPPPRLSPAMIWQRARHGRRLRAEAMASRIITLGQLGCGALALGVLAYFGLQLELTSTAPLAASAPILPWAGGTLILTAGSMLAMFRWLSRGRS